MAFKQLVFLLLVCIPGSVRGEECKRPIIPHSNSTSSTPLLKNGEDIVVMCYDGFSNGHSQSSYTICIDGVLKPPVPECYANCYRPVVPHSDANSPTPVLRHGEYLTVTCDTGYSNGKTQSTLSQCQDGKMIPAILNCYANCVPRMIPHSDHSTQQPDVLNGQTTTIKCCKNFSMGPDTQSITLTCYDGDLNDGTVRCYANCQLVQSPINGNITKGSPPFYHNKEVVFGCCPEYTLIGDKKIICSDGSWNGYPPVCVKNKHQLSTDEIVSIAAAAAVVIVLAVLIVGASRFIKRHQLSTGIIATIAATVVIFSYVSISITSELVKQLHQLITEKIAAVVTWITSKLVKPFSVNNAGNPGATKEELTAFAQNDQVNYQATGNERIAPTTANGTSTTSSPLPTTTEQQQGASSSSEAIGNTGNTSEMASATSRSIEDKTIEALAEEIGTNPLEKLGLNLGYEYAAIGIYNENNSAGGKKTYDGTRQMLKDWRNNTLQAQQRSGLKKALVDAGFAYLAEKHLEGKTELN